MSHFAPEKFSDPISTVNKLAYQARSTALAPIERPVLERMISNLELPVKGTEVLEDILRHRKEEEVVLRAHLQKILFKDTEE